MTYNVLLGTFNPTLLSVLTHSLTPRTTYTKPTDSVAAADCEKNTLTAVRINIKDFCFFV